MSAPSSNAERPVKIFFVLVALALGLSIMIPFGVVTAKDGLGSGARWVLSEGGVVAGLIGCLLIAPFLRRWRERQPAPPAPEPQSSPPDDDFRPTIT